MKFTGGALILCLAFAASVNSVAINKEGLGGQLDESGYPTSDYPTSKAPTSHYPTSQYPTTQPPKPSTTTYRPYTTTPKPYPSPTTTPKTTHKPPEDVSCFFHTIYKEGEHIIMEGDENIHETPEECETSCYVSTFEFCLAV